MRTGRWGRGGQSGLLGVAVLAADALASLVTVFCPQDQRGTPPTRTGSADIILATVSSLATILRMVLVQHAEHHHSRANTVALLQPPQLKLALVDPPVPLFWSYRVLELQAGELALD